MITWARYINRHPQLLMTWVVLASAVALSRPRLGTAEEDCRPLMPSRPAGVYLRPSEPSREGPFEFSERFDPSSYERSDYVKRPNDKEPVPFYRHGRGIAPSMGHHGRLVLINDYFATKACEVMIADLTTHKSWNIDSTATETYKRNAEPDSRLIVIPEAYGFSPSDRQVLIGMSLVYVSVPTAELAGQIGKSYKKWWYVVDSSSGRVLHEYRTMEPPPCWWVY